MFKLIFISLLSIAIFSACQQDEKTEVDEKTTTELSASFDSSALQTTAIEDIQDKSFYFRYIFPEGESVRYRLTTISTTEQNVIASDSSMTEQIDQKITFIINFKPISVDQDSITELECTFASINLYTKARGQEFNYQSGSENDSAKKVQFAEYEALVNIPFNVRVSQLGTILEIYKVDKIMNRFLDLRGLSDSVDVQQKLLASQDLSSRSIKPLLTQIFREVPQHKMAIDSTWSQKREPMPLMVFQVNSENRYKVAGLEMFNDDMLAVVSGSVNTTITGDQVRTDRGVTYTFDKPKSTASGKVYFNISKGLVQKSRTESRIEVGYKMEMASPEGMQRASAKEVNTNVNVLELL